MGRKAKSHNMTVSRGKTWAETFMYLDETTAAPVDLTGYTARMQIRTLTGRTGLTTTTTLVMELTTADGRLIITPLTGQIDLMVSAIDTALLSPLNKRIRYVYELELVDPTESPEIVIPFLTGRISVYPEVSR